ncbi:hypothetical protein F5X68DRAFT_203399 [Plectosphaerella plurivora]|uniref:AMP-activated protein kinase glycogen-binding domain-containing protein n=1 Tax=Plectosphaerella plurivora TaxID=936078 RepID=A0A9P8VH06_9PEZI|nr:hypothetical protein F5X68DRAFT_203399 [Plectosphaerella plurivora]
MPGTFKFTWAHAAEEVYVTGTFDQWTKSEKLEKVGDKFEKTVLLPDATKKIYYKFVVDNNWIIDHTAPQELDHEGNQNNFLTPEQITKQDTTPATAVMSNISPDATTAALAKDVPLEKKEELNDATPTGGPGFFPATPADELDKPVGINPLPATDVTEPSIVLAPGEPIPPSAKAGDINAGVTLDKESYEKSDRLPGLTDENSKLPELTSETIPESSLPVTAAAIAPATINSVGPESTTAALAAEVPLETKTVEVPEVVKESQEKADVSPEASAQPAEVAEKAAVEEELKEKVPEAPSTSEGTAGFGTQKSETAGIAAAAITAGGIALAAATAAKDAIFTKAEPAVTEASNAATEAAAQLPEPVKEQLPVSVQDTLKTHTQEKVAEETASNVPEPVKESLVEAGKAPEAAANPVAVEEKKEVEAELLKEVKAVPAVSGESTKTEDVKSSLKAAVNEAKPTTAVTSAPKTEATAADIQKPAETTATEAPSTTAVTAVTSPEPADKPLVEAPVDATAAVATQTAESTKTEETKTEEPKKETNGSTATETKASEPATPAKAESSKPAAATPSTGTGASAEKKKKNRLSAFFGKIKSKVSHKD